MFPTDFSIGKGETAFVNVEYLPSEVGLHEARFAMVQVRRGLNGCHHLHSCLVATISPGQSCEVIQRKKHIFDPF